MYNEFATLYDKLIKSDIDYEKIISFVLDIIKDKEKKPELVCEMACGTGNVTIPLAKLGLNMIALDRSADMLDIAREKAAAEGLSDILFLNQSMQKIDLYGTCDLFLCMIDGFNYVTSINQLKAIFKRIRTCFIENDGIMIFDISSEQKLKNILGNNTYIYNTDDVFYTWENKTIGNVCKMELNFFVKEGNSFNRFEEVHVQRAYKESEISEALIEAGFSEVNVYDGYTKNQPKVDSERLVFVAKA